MLLTATETRKSYTIGENPINVELSATIEVGNMNDTNAHVFDIIISGALAT